MRPRTIALAALLVALPTVSATSQEPATGEPPPVAAVVEDVAQPGPQHELLARLVGDWDYTMKVWLTPDTEPVESTGTAEARAILGGRFIHTIYRGELFDKPYEAWATDGFDNQTNQYVSTWRDTQGTYTLIFGGVASADGAVRTMEAKLTDPLSGTSLRIRSLTTFEDDDHFVYETSLLLSNERTFKNMELSARRRGGS